MDSLDMSSGLSGAMELTTGRAFEDAGVAVAYERYRLYADLSSSLGAGLARSNSLSDAGVGVDARLLGDEGSAFRLGAGAQVTDRAPHSEFRLLGAGDLGRITYAGQLGVGNQFVVGLAGGVRVAAPAPNRSVTVGMEMVETSALRTSIGALGSDRELLFSGSLGGDAGEGRLFRVKVAAGAGVAPQVGIPEWRGLLAFELSDHGSH